MHTALIALVSALSVAGVGTTAVAMSGNGMTGNHQMMGDAEMGPGMYGGQNGMHGGMREGMDNDTHGGYRPHGDCPCCDFGNDTNETGGT